MPPYSHTPEGRRAYYEKNRDRINAHRKAKRDADPEGRARRAAQMRDHRASNPEQHRRRDVERKRTSIYWRAKVQCVKCGYDKYPGALQWHHVDPSTKTAQPSALMRKSDTVVIEELLKCVLVCANCHWEVEAGLWEVTDDHREASDGFVRHAAGARYNGSDSTQSATPVPEKPA